MSVELSEFENARKTISEIDKEIASLFEKRMNVANTIAEYKMDKGLPIEDLVREEQLINRNISYIKDEKFIQYYIDFQHHIMNLSKDYQRTLFEGTKVGFSGIEGAFADIAARKVFPNYKTVGYPDFKTAYKAAEKGETSCVFLPIENSYNGDVGQVMDLAFFGNLYINGVYEAKIIQNLVGVKGTDLSKIKTVFSHPQALGQCAPFIEKYGYKTSETVNTAVAAKMVADENREDWAAIASEEACEKYGLVKLVGNINESTTNTTRFAVFSPNQKKPNAQDNRFVLLFTVKDIAGALGKAVSVIGNYGFNLNALKSRPTKELVWNYYFYAEGEGAICSERGQEMLKELKEYCDVVRVLGSYSREIELD